MSTRSPAGRALRAAFVHTVPVLTGFLFLGLAFGILMSSKGYGPFWSFLMSALCFCGSMQFVAITLLTAAFDPLGAFLLSLMVNARHLFYGISLLKKYKGIGGVKPLLIFWLCDETFSIACSTDPPDGVSRAWFYFWISLLDYSYWVTGSTLGGLVGGLVSFDTTGLDFVLTALFVVIFLGQWQERKNRRSAVVGVVCTALCLAVFGPDNFIIPSMLVILAVLMLLRRGEVQRP